MKNAAITGRHLVGMAAVALANPLIYFGGGFYQWSITFITPLLFAAVVYGLYALFFTKRAKGSWPGSFFALAWILLGLAVLVPWMDKSPQQKPVTQSAPSSKEKNEGVKKKYLTDENMGFGTSGITSATQPWGANDKPVANYDGWGESDKPVSIQRPHLTTPATNSSGMSDRPLQSSAPSEAPGEIDFLLLMAPPHASKASDYNKILQMHPDAVQISQNSKFMQWVLSNPKTWNAIKSHDTDGLIAIFSEFKSRN